ncbi:MAG: hypothetical protein EOP02_12810 [Proteobacteria bacterium]|nr:MAG: hypothetical protein EOP02_12810 [Pseudomonadota bacterium]
MMIATEPEPVRKIVGLIALGVLLIEFPLLGFVRTGTLEVSELTSGFLPAIFMGFWGWVLLFSSEACRREERLGLSWIMFGLAIIYFFVTTLLAADIIINGNSTSGIAFVTYPFFMAPVIILLCLFLFVFDFLLSRRNQV